MATNNNLTIREATAQDVIDIVPVAREADLLEISRMGLDPVECFTRAVEQSEVAMCCHIDGEVVAVWGARSWSTITGLGLPWLITGRKVNENRRAFVAWSKVFLAQLQRQFPRLVVMIDSEYKQALRWASWLGFDLGDPVPMGPGRHPFVPARIGEA